VDVTLYIYERCVEENSCSHDNGGCSHLCIHRPARRTPACLCPHSMRLQLDNKTCVIPDAYLLYSRHDDIRRVSLGDRVIADDDFVVETGTHSSTAIDCLVAGSRVFWTDSSEKVTHLCYLLIQPGVTTALTYLIGSRAEYDINPLHYYFSADSFWFITFVFAIFCYGRWWLK